jgi:predicted transcriptional regulator
MISSSDAVLTNNYNSSSWAKMPLDGKVEEILDSIENAMPVSLIATFPFECCQDNNQTCEVLNRPELREFDHLPVRNGSGQIVGVLNRNTKRKDETLVREAMQHLCEEVLVTANAPLLSFVETADHREYMMVVDGQKITGIVTRSDIQKLAVRPALFLRITCLELLLAQWLRKNCSDEQTWMKTLSQSRQTKINDSWASRQKNNLAIDKISTTELDDKSTAVIELGAFPDRECARKRLEWVVKLRHSVAHAGDFALTPENADRVAQVTRDIKKLISEMHDALKEVGG